MLLTALPPAPPTPHTTMRGFNSFSRGTFRLIGISCLSRRRRSLRLNGWTDQQPSQAPDRRACSGLLSPLAARPTSVQLAQRRETSPIRATVQVLALMVNVLCMGRLVSRLVLDHPTSWFDREATISSSRLILVGRYAVVVEGGRTPFRSDLSLMATNTAAHLLDRESRFVLIVRWLDGLAGNYAHVCGRRGRFHRSNAAF